MQGDNHSRSSVEVYSQGGAGERAEIVIYEAIDKIAVQVGTAREQKIDADGADWSTLTCVGSSRNQGSNQEGILQAHQIHCLAFYLNQPTAGFCCNKARSFRWIDINVDEYRIKLAGRQKNRLLCHLWSPLRL